MNRRSSLQTIWFHPSRKGSDWTVHWHFFCCSAEKIESFSLFTSDFGPSLKFGSFDMAINETSQKLQTCALSLLALEPSEIFNWSIKRSQGRPASCFLNSFRIQISHGDTWKKERKKLQQFDIFTMTETRRNDLKEKLSFFNSGRSRREIKEKSQIFSVDTRENSSSKFDQFEDLRCLHTCLSSRRFSGHRVEKLFD